MTWGTTTNKRGMWHCLPKVYWWNDDSWRSFATWTICLPMPVDVRDFLPATICESNPKRDEPSSFAMSRQGDCPIPERSMREKWSSILLLLLLLQEGRNSKRKDTARENASGRQQKVNNKSSDCCQKGEKGQTSCQVWAQHLGLWNLRDWGCGGCKGRMSRVQDHCL